jgi:hypothetical protein
VHHWPAFSFALPLGTNRDDALSPLTQDRPKALIGHDARFMKVPARNVAIENVASPQRMFSAAADGGFTAYEAAQPDASVPPASSHRNWKPYAFGIGYAVFAVSTAGASLILLAASIQPH